MNLPKNESVIMFNYNGEVTGHNYGGNLRVKCVLNMADKRNLEIERSLITADLSNPTPNLIAIAQVIANLRVRVIDAPEWFRDAVKSLDLVDDDVYFELYAKCMEAEDAWLKSVKGESLGEQTEVPQGNEEMKTSQA
jgi:hypothetical protein